MSKLSPTLTLLSVALIAVAFAVGIAGATATTDDTLVTSGSQSSPFSQNKQNEPAVAVNPYLPSIAAAGVNEELDMEACNDRSDTTCPFTTGVGVSGIYFSDTGGDSWAQPTYTGWTCATLPRPRRNAAGEPARQLRSARRSDRHAAALLRERPRFRTATRRSGFGPLPDAQGHFAWTNGWRLYYANLSANFSAERSEQSFKGFEAIGVSRLDSQNYAAAKAGVNNAWKAPVIVSKQNAALFSDHEMIAVDDAANSPFFGNVYVCDTAFRSQEIAGFPQPIEVNSSSDGGSTWRTRQLSEAAANNKVGGRQDCAVDTDSAGNVYVFWDGFDSKSGSDAIFMARSSDGAKTFQRPAKVVTPIVTTGLPDPEQGGLSFDGAAGARGGSFPTISIANGAPFGTTASDEILLAWPQGPTPSDLHPGPNERVHVLWSKDGGTSWTSGGIASPATDRPDFPAIAISPERPRRVPHLHELPAAVAVDDRGAADVRRRRAARRRRSGQRCRRDVERPAPGGAHGRRPRVERERADGRVPRRLQLRLRDERGRRRRLERRPRCGRLSARSTSTGRSSSTAPRRRTRTTRLGRRRTTTARRRSATPTSSAARTPTRHRRVSSRREGGRRSRPPVKFVT